MIVVDAGAIAELLLGRPAASGVARHLSEHERDLHAPHLLDVEVLSALRRLVAAGQATAARAEEAIEDLLALGITRYPHHLLVQRAWQYRLSFTACDATYLALAEALADAPAPLLTTDARFARAIGARTGVPVLLVDAG